jgi:hypothetical protein
MASDTTLASSEIAVDDCAGFAEPADILTRLNPDDLHPARLAGPHAWHPWGLTGAPPSDRHLRLTLAADIRPETADRVLERLERQLASTSWPPEAPLAVHRRDSRLDCRDDAARRSLIEITVAPDGEDREHAEVVTRDGWPILGELAALSDRIGCVDVDSPSHADLADLTSWVEHKMAEPVRTGRLTVSLEQLLGDQARYAPNAAERLRLVLNHREAAGGQPQRVLGYLAEQLDHHSVRGQRARR